MTKLNSKHFGKSVLLVGLLLAAVPLQAADEQESEKQNYHTRHRIITIKAAIANADANADLLAKQKVDNSKTAAVLPPRSELSRYTIISIRERMAAIQLAESQKSKPNAQSLQDPIAASDESLPTLDRKARTKEEIMQQLMNQVGVPISRL